MAQQTGPTDARLGTDLARAPPAQALRGVHAQQALDEVPAICADVLRPGDVAAEDVVKDGLQQCLVWAPELPKLRSGSQAAVPWQAWSRLSN